MARREEVPMGLLDNEGEGDRTGPLGIEERDKVTRTFLEGSYLLTMELLRTGLRQRFSIEFFTALISG